MCRDIVCWIEWKVEQVIYRFEYSLKECNDWAVASVVKLRVYINFLCQMQSKMTQLEENIF